MAGTHRVDSAAHGIVQEYAAPAIGTTQALSVRIQPDDVAASEPLLGNTQPAADFFLLGLIDRDIILRAARATGTTPSALEAQRAAVIKGYFGHLESIRLGL